MSKETIKTRILIISDTHCAPLAETPGDGPPWPPFKAPLPSVDLLIHCGDLTHTGKVDEYHKTLDMLQQINAPVKLVIAGNHDLTLDRDFVFSHLEQNKQFPADAEAQTKQIRDLWTSPSGRAQAEGVRLLDEGSHLIRLANGAQAHVYANPYTPEFYDWGFPYARDEDRFNPAEASLADVRRNIAHHPVPAFSSPPPSPIDIMVTHGPPWARLDRTDRGDFAGCPHLLRALMRARPRVHCFGHIHEGWGAERIHWSEGVERICAEPVATEVWKNGGWARGVEGIEKVSVDLEEAEERKGVFLDLSGEEGAKGGKAGNKTVLINAAIMDVKYRPVNAPWVVDVELPRAR